MKTTFCVLLLAASLCVVQPAYTAEVTGSGHVISETRGVSGFHGVKLKGSGDVVVTQGDTEGLVIDAEDNLLPLIESTVGDDGILTLGFKPHTGSVETHQGVTYKLAVKTLDHLSVEGSGSIHAAALAAGSVRFSLPGSGEITVDQLKADAGDIEINGSGTVTLGGESHHQTVRINGSGNCQAGGFKTGDAKVTINGSGEASVQVDGALTAEVNGSGEVAYSGHPTVTKTIHGSGEVHPSGAKHDD